MKHLKHFENNNKFVLPEKLEYIILKTKIAFNSKFKINEMFIVQIISKWSTLKNGHGIIETYYADTYIEDKKQNKSIYYEIEDKSYSIINFGIFTEITRSKNKEELETILNANKYNL